MRNEQPQCATTMPHTEQTTQPIPAGTWPYSYVIGLTVVRQEVVFASGFQSL